MLTVQFTYEDFKINFDKDASTVIIIHGFITEPLKVDWVLNMVKSAIFVKNKNAIVVDWSAACGGFNYIAVCQQGFV